MTDSVDQPAVSSGDVVAGRRPPRRRVILATLRGAATTCALMALYYSLPLDADAFVTSIVLKLAVGIVVFSGLMTWNVRGIVGSDTPGLKAFESLFVAVPLFLLIFSATYFLVSQADESHFSEPLTWTDALYFTVTVFSTVGFGDIAPKSEPIRLLVAAQMILDLVVLGVGVRVIASAVQRGRERLDE